jgi:hypothetical protein
VPEKPVISTQNPSALLSPSELARLSQSLAALDAVLMPEWEDRYYSFTTHWNGAERMASMRNGSGDGYFLWFGQQGTVLKGFAHESAVWKHLRGRSDLALSSLTQQIPPELEPFLHEPAFSIEETTFCLWRQPQDSTWITWLPPVPPEVRFFDGSADLLMLLDGKPVTYQEWATDYYEIRPKRTALRAVYAHTPLTEDLLKRLGSPRTRDEITAELDEIGYPSI